MFEFEYGILVSVVFDRWDDENLTPYFPSGVGENYCEKLTPYFVWRILSSIL